jgi:hypothetical protein
MVLSEGLRVLFFTNCWSKVMMVPETLIALLCALVLAANSLRISI